MEKKERKRAVITGGASGLGRALAVAFAHDGYEILIADIDEVGAKGTQKIVDGEGGYTEVMQCDVASRDEVKRLADYVFGGWGGADVLVNNAGLGAQGRGGEIPLEVWDKVFGVNFWGAVNCCHYFIPKMRERGGGHIVVIASIAAFAATPEMSIYNTSKAALFAFSETLFSELAGDSIGVTVACPSFFKTNIIENLSQDKRYTNDFAVELGRAVLENAKMSADDIAREVVRGVNKKELYVFPQPSAKKLWRTKRFFPMMVLNFSARLVKSGKFESFLMRQARKGKL